MPSEQEQLTNASVQAIHETGTVTTLAVAAICAMVDLEQIKISDLEKLRGRDLNELQLSDIGSLEYIAKETMDKFHEALDVVDDKTSLNGFLNIIADALDDIVRYLKSRDEYSTGDSDEDQNDNLY